MRKLITIIGLVALLGTVSVSPVLAEAEQTVTASVTVTELISITLSGPCATGLAFGQVNPGDDGNEPSGQNESTSGITITVGPETNTNVDLGTRANSPSLAVSNWKYSTTYAGTPDSYADTYSSLASNLSATDTQPAWFWLDVPAGTAAGDYSSTLYFKAVKTGDAF